MFIGRFQPFHNGHKAVIDKALENADNVLVLVGSPDQPRSIRNPFTFEERAAMIADSFPFLDRMRLSIEPLPDQPYADDLWVASVQRLVNFMAMKVGATRIGLVGFSKDATSYYLKLFPTWGSVNAESSTFHNWQTKQTEILGSTFLRELMFTDPAGLVQCDHLMPTMTTCFLKSFVSREPFRRLKHEYDHVKEYKASWAAAPYPPTFVCTDAVVVQSGHILLVERGAQPGKGLMALPGGFLGQDETLLDGCIRELREETRLKVPEPVLRGSLVSTRVFDDPNRSTRGRTITHAFLFHLSPQLELPKVKGSDDAAKAKWVPLACVDPMQMFEDHYAIIQRMTSIL